MKHSVCSEIALILVAGLLGLPAAAQSSASGSSDTSLGDYARQIHKNSGTGSKPKVFDNDNLPTNDKLSVIGTENSTPDDAGQTKSADSSAPAGEAKPGETKSAAEEKGAPKPVTGTEEERAAATKQWEEKLNSQKDQIDLLGRELDVLQREYQVRAAAMYADAGNRMRNAADWDKQDAQYKQQIADKQKALDDAKQKMEDTQEEARKAGVSASVRDQAAPAPAQ